MRITRRKLSHLWPMSWAAGIAAVFYDVFIQSPWSSGNAAVAAYVSGTLIFPGALTMLHSFGGRRRA
jgi:hypothetical protein